MKNIRFNIITAVAVSGMLLFATSCSKTFYTKANVNPNQPSVVPPGTLLPMVEISLTYAMGGDGARYSGIFDQQGYGANREQAAIQAYQITGTNLPDNFWNNMYANDMNNAYTLMTMANSNGYNRYAGIASILMAYSMQCTVDFWGSVPYSQAFLGASNINPAYDQDQAIYNNMISLLNTAIADLQNPSPGALIPSSDDVIYGGNAQLWIAFANAEKARIYIHQCKHSNAAMCTAALNAADSAIAEGFTNAQVTYTGIPNSSPVYQFNTGWGDITYVTSAGVHATLYDTMFALTDPRINVYFDTAGSATAATPVVGMGAYYGSPNSPVELISKEEVEFIQAEATLRGAGLGTIAQAQIYYANAITDNFTKLGIAASAPAYIAANPLPVANNAAAQYVVGKQEWMALFMNPEAWACWRRTGAPALQSANVGLQIPRRMVLPNDEITLNANAIQNETLWSPIIFWDK